MADSHTPAPLTDSSHALPPAGETGGHAHHPDEKPHPTWKQYKWVALILTVITVVEVWIYYIPAFVASRLFVPSLLIMSAIKFAIVVLFYMHLRYDHKLFKVLFTGPLIIAITSVIALMFLFGQIAVRLS
ncbi:MAG: cytochrome C oxidase subunit IV family protein [Gemmatimonadaceae bacterium]